jgi:hypothetical protein
MAEARVALTLTASSSPAALTSAAPTAGATASAAAGPIPSQAPPLPAQKSSRPPRVIPSARPPQPKASVAPPERPNPSSAPDEYVTVNESEVSFASIAPPAAQQLAAMAPLARQSHRPSGRQTPPRSEIAQPASVHPPAGSPLSDPEIRISIEEEEPQ